MGIKSFNSCKIGQDWINKSIIFGDERIVSPITLWKWNNLNIFMAFTLIKIRTFYVYIE